MVMISSKEFICFRGDKIPPPSEDDFMIKHNSSDYYLAKVESMSGVIQPALIRYCFERKMWISTRSGTFKVLEYYQWID